MGSGGGRSGGEELRVGVAARPLAALLGSLREALAVVEPDQVPARDAVDLVAVLDRIERLAAAGKALAAGRVAESSLWSRGGHRSPAHWMAQQCGVSVGDAARMLDRAETVADAPATKDAFVAGRLSGRQADTVGRAERADPAAGRRLAEAAPRLSMGELQSEANRITAAASSETPEQTAARHRKASRFRHGMTADGMGWGSWLLPPGPHTRAISLIEGEQQKVFTEARAAGTRDSVENHAAQALCRVLDRAGDPGSKRPTSASAVDVDADRSGSDEAAPSPSAAEPSTIEEHSEGLSVEDELSDSVEPSNEDGGSGAHVVEDWSFAKVLVIADLTALDRGHVQPGERCEVAGQGPIPVADVWKMIDGDAFVAAISTKGTEISKVVHLGRRPTALQRTALEYLSGGMCSIEGCTSRARLETDHVAEWAATHRTELAELAPACGHHHDLKTHHGHRFGPLQANGKRELIAPDPPGESRSPDATAPPDLTIVEHPPPPPPTPRTDEPPSHHPGADRADTPPDEPHLSPPPQSAEARARAIGRRNQGALFDTG